MSKLNTQFGESVTGDFEENTWTFEMTSKDYKVAGGTFAIVPKDKYDRLLVAMRGISQSVMAHPDYQPDSEFMDMVSRCVNSMDDVV